MKEYFADIATADGTMRTFVVHPERDGPFPAVILYMDFWGVREELYDIARWVATVGFCCAVPDLYYRQGIVQNEIYDQQGRMTSLNRLDEATQAKVLAPLRQLSDAQAMEDTGAILRFFAGDGAVRAGAKGCFGFCLGGRLAMRAAAGFPDQINAAASMHGSALVIDGQDSPHLLADKIKGEFYCGFAEHDPYTPSTTPARIAAQIKPGAALYEYNIHAGTEHGYALPNRDIYCKRASLRDWEMILAMFHRQIPPYRWSARTQ
jgi:carboxymethylenebutenolidase